MSLAALLLALAPLSLAQANEAGGASVEDRVEDEGPSFDELFARLRILRAGGGTTPPQLRHELRAAVAREVKADPGRASAVVARGRALDAACLLAVVDGLVTAEVRPAVGALAALVGDGSGLDVFVLDALARLGMRLGGPFDERARHPVRFALGASDPQVRAGAARAAGALEDDEAVPELIALLADREPHVVAAAREGLVTYSGFDYGEDGEQWQRWFERERRFLDEELPRLARVLATGEPERRAEAIKAIVAGRLGRHERARVLVEAYAGLGRDGLRRQVLAGLGTLRSRVGLPLLAEVAELEPDDALRHTAEAALALVHGSAAARPGGRAVPGRRR